jgi:hypothetical protein
VHLGAIKYINIIVSELWVIKCIKGGNNVSRNHNYIAGDDNSLCP